MLVNPTNIVHLGTHVVLPRSRDESRNIYVSSQPITFALGVSCTMCGSCGLSSHSGAGTEHRDLWEQQGSGRAYSSRDRIGSGTVWFQQFASARRGAGGFGAGFQPRHFVRAQLQRTDAHGGPVAKWRSRGASGACGRLYEPSGLHSLASSRGKRGNQCRRIVPSIGIAGVIDDRMRPARHRVDLGRVTASESEQPGAGFLSAGLRPAKIGARRLQCLHRRPRADAEPRYLTLTPTTIANQPPTRRVQ